MTEKRWLYLALVVAISLSAPASSWAGDGVVALQTADPSCPDDSGNRYVNCGNGTVTDNLTGLVWLKDASCLGFQVEWREAMEFVAGLSDVSSTSAAKDDDCGLSDGSSASEWRLPSIEEWEAMIADAVALGCTSSGFGGPAITDDSGASCWQEGPGNSFTGVETAFYWSSTTRYSGLVGPGQAFTVWLTNGLIEGVLNKTNTLSVWPVRGGQ